MNPQSVASDPAPEFYAALSAASKGSGPVPKQWAFIPYDQLSDQLGLLGERKVGEVGIVLIESEAKASRRPYHRRKLALLLANMRHFAVEQAQRGVPVRYLMTRAPYAEVLRKVAKDTGPLSMMEPAERELRHELAPLIKEKLLEITPHEGWLTNSEDFAQSESKAGGAPYRMDAFYRAVRRRTGILMTPESKPEGGRFSFDGENRKAWPGEPAEPRLPEFESTKIKDEVCALVNEKFAHHPGVVAAQSLPTTFKDAQKLWAWAKRHCLPFFGPFEDAMAVEARRLFHTKISELLNMHRLLPRVILDDALALALPLASKEGFVRQVVGWREFVRHVHLATDGFRAATTSMKQPRVKKVPGDGGYATWAGKAWKRGAKSGGDGGAQPDFLSTEQALPAAYWGAASGLNCLDTVVTEVWEAGYSHHITRLMILSNLATLLDVSPRELTDWFWAAYSDAYDWVVEPNVLGMGTFAAGPVMTTKPYVSGAAYIDRMSDYCKSCAFHPKKNCPITPLYWNFLRSKEPQLKDNQRLALPLGSMRRRSPQKVAHDEAVFAHVTKQLQLKQALSPSDEVFGQ